MPTLTPEAWAKIRYAYEHTDRTLGDIAAEFGIAKDTITRRRQLWGWTLRRPAVPRQGPLAVAPLAPFTPPSCGEGSGVGENPQDKVTPTPPPLAVASQGDPPPQGEGKMAQP
jgi:hypothetical protein